MFDPYKNFDSIVTPNGLTVYVSHLPECSWESVGFLIHSGAEQDPVGLEGTAHFVEHLVSENASIPKEDLESFFRNKGGNINLGSTGNNGTQYSFFLPFNKDGLHQAFGIIGKMLLFTKLTRCVERERQVIIEEFHREYPSKLSLSMKRELRKRKALYSGFWLERLTTSLGTPESIKKITERDLQGYYDKHYTPTNMSIVCVGGMTLSEVVEMLSHSPFAEKKNGERTPNPIPLTDLAPPTETQYRSKVISTLRGVFTNTSIYESVAKVPISGNLSTIGLVQEMLRRSLNEEIRERRAWTYHIGVMHQNHRHFFEFGIYCKALARRAVNDIDAVVEDCILGLQSKEDALENEKRYFLNKNTMVDISGRELVMLTLYMLAKHHRIRTITETNEDIRRVTMDDVRETLLWLTPERRWTSLT